MNASEAVRPIQNPKQCPLLASIVERLFYIFLSEKPYSPTLRPENITSTLGAVRYKQQIAEWKVLAVTFRFFNKTLSNGIPKTKEGRGEIHVLGWTHLANNLVTTAPSFPSTAIRRSRTNKSHIQLPTGTYIVCFYTEKHARGNETRV